MLAHLLGRDPREHQTLDLAVLGLALLVLSAIIVAAPAQGKATRGPQLLNLRIDNGSTPFAGDGRYLATVSPNGDGFRDAAHIHFSLGVPATVTMDVTRTVK